jgi:hypothetical protein
VVKQFRSDFQDQIIFWAKDRLTVQAPTPATRT